MKSGFTRTGKRTLGGAIDDGVKAVVRYYLNNFQDGVKQDAIDLFTGENTAQLRWRQVTAISLGFDHRAMTMAMLAVIGRRRRGSAQLSVGMSSSAGGG
jgi:hypothetical protein